MLKVLFVDDEAFVLQTLERQLKPIAPDWEMAFVASGQEALDRLEKEHFEVIVTDMRMPGMDGAAVLESVHDQHPQMIRIVLSAYSDEGVTLKTVGTAHQYLTKPCEPQKLKGTIARAAALRGLLESEAIRKVISQVDSLPSLPMLYLELLDELKSADASIQRAGEIIERDVAMTAKKTGIPVVAIAGQLGEGAEEVLAHGIDAFFSIHDGPMTLDDAFARSPELLANAAEQTTRLFLAARGAS